MALEKARAIGLWSRLRRGKVRMKVAGREAVGLYVKPCHDRYLPIDTREELGVPSRPVAVCLCVTRGPCSFVRLSSGRKELWKLFIDYGTFVCSTQKIWREKGDMVHGAKNTIVAFFSINETKLLFLAVWHTNLTHPQKCLSRLELYIVLPQTSFFCVHSEGFLPIRGRNYGVCNI